MGEIYSVTFSAVAVTAAQDTFEITASSTKPLIVHGCYLSQYSDAGDAQDELLSVLILRGYTVSGSGGSSATPAALNPSAAAASFAAEVNNTTVANTGSPVTLHSDSFNVRAGWIYIPTPECRPGVAASSRLVIRITAPADSITMNGTLLVEEVG